MTFYYEINSILSFYRQLLLIMNSTNFVSAFLDVSDDISWENKILSILSEEKFAPLKEILKRSANFQEKADESYERERKFLVNKELLPSLDQYSHKEIEQHYLTTGDEEIRIRKQDSDFFLTIKKWNGTKRIEIEVPIFESEFSALFLLAEKSIKKTRYEISLENWDTAELDLYPDGFSSLEVEFETDEEMTTFTPPQWFGREVSGKPEFSNAQRATPLKKTEKGEKAEEITQGISSRLEENHNALPTLDLKEGFEEITRRIEEFWDTQEVIIVNVAGGSASGKTSQVAKKVYEKYGDQAVLLSMDNYYRGTTFMNEVKETAGVELNYDQPEVMDIELLSQHLEELKQGKTIQQPLYDFATWERTWFTPVESKKVIILEGLFPLVDELAENADVKTYVDVSLHGMLMRRLMRDIDRGSRSIAENMKYIFDVAEPRKREYIDPTLTNADFIISNEYNPSIESVNAKAREQQLKFEGSISRDTLRKLGAENLASTQQTDFYYPSKHPGEYIRMRHEGGNIIFWYKGPLMPNGTKHKLEFEIDEGIEQDFKRYFWEPIKEIQKERGIWSMKGITFSVDRIGSGEMKHFIEIRRDAKDSDEEIVALCEKLWLNFEEGKKISYFDIIE